MTDAAKANGQDDASLAFGIFDWIDANAGLTPGEIYEQRLRMIEYADAAGFWCYHLAEHHGTPLSMAPAPNVFLAAAAERTQRLRLGPLVQLLPLANPIRNIEEVCVLDHLSNGRLELGVGRGISAEELVAYGVDPAEARDRFQESLDILLMGFTTGEVSYEGRFYSLKDSPTTIRPKQQPYPPLWYPASGIDRVPWIAGERLNTIFGYAGESLANTTAQVSRYREVLANPEPGHQALNAHVAQPRYGVTRHIYVGPTDAEALAVARTAYTDFDHNFVVRPGRRPGEHTSRRGNFDTAYGNGLVFTGSPETVRREAQALIDATGINYLLCVFAFGSLSTDQVLGSIRLFAEAVMPALTPAASAAPVES